MQTPTLRNRVRVQKWAHPCARDKHSPLTCTPGTAAKCHRISQASGVRPRGVGPATPPPGPVLGQPGEAAVVSAWTSGPQSPQTRRPELSVSSLRTIFYTHTGTDRSAPSLLKGEGLKNRQAILAGPGDEPHLNARGGSPTRLHILLTQPHVTPPLLGLLGPRRPGGQCHRPGAGGQQPRGGHVPSAPAGWCPQDAEQCPASQG